MSHASEYQNPPPRHHPFTAAITGFDSSMMCIICCPCRQSVSTHRSRTSRCRCTSGRSPPRSYPAENAGPFPVRMIARTEGSAAASSSA